MTHAFQRWFGIGCIATCTFGTLPVALGAQGQGLRETFLTAASDSIREGQYRWAEGTLRTLLLQNPSDWDVVALLAVSVAGGGDFASARRVAASLDTARGASPQIVAIVGSAISRYESAGRLRSDFIAGVQSGNVGAIQAAIAKGELGPEQSALARGALCVMTGDRQCLRAATAKLPRDGAASRIGAQLEQQLDVAEVHARAYGLALGSFAGAPTTLPTNDSLVTAERAAHAACPKVTGIAFSDGALLKKLNPVLECRRKLIARMVQYASQVVESAPLSRTGLEAALTVALLSETQASVDSATSRMKRAVGAVEWPLWQQRDHKSKAAFDLEQISVPHVLRVTDQAVELLETAFADTLVPLGLAASSGSPEREVVPIAATSVRSLWRIELIDVRKMKQSVQQPIDWDKSGVETIRWLGAGGFALEFRAQRPRRVPYPVGVFHFSRAFLEAPTRAVLRSFAASLTREIGLETTQVDMVDSVRTTSKFGTIFNTAVALSSIATGDVATGAKATTSLENDAAKAAASVADRDAWVRATQQSRALQNALSVSVGQEWVAELLSKLALVRPGVD